MSLTGGLDTRMIMAWHKAAPGSLPCYSFGGMLRDSRDVRVARRVAKACGQPHDTIGVGDEVLRRVRAFKPVEPEPGLFTKEFLKYVYQSRETYANVINVHPLSFAVFR